VRLCHDWRSSSSIVVVLSRRGRTCTRSSGHGRVPHHLLALSSFDGLLSVRRAGVLMARLVAAESGLVCDGGSLEGAIVPRTGLLLFRGRAQRWEGRGV